MQSLPSHEQALLERIDQEGMLGQVQSWAAVNSGSGNLSGLAETAGLLADAFAILPGSIELVDPAPVDKVRADGVVETVQHGQHLVLTVRPDAPTQLLFTGHMDTVFAIDHSFQQQRWIEPGVLNGPGVADMKGGIAVMLAALQAAETSGGFGSAGYQILLNSDEEVGSPSSERGGSGNFSIIITGKSAHAGRNPQDGRNALLAAADLALRLKALTRDGLTVNPAKIDGGSPNNVVPDHAVLRVNFRPRSPQIVVKAEAELRKLVADIEREHDISAHIHGSFGRPPKPIDKGAAKLFDLVKRCGADLGLPIAWKSSGGVCDGNNIAACGVPVVDTMGVRGGNIHSSEEFLITESLGERARLSALTIIRIAEKGAL
jgi:glutamate carboxypeptidase